MTLARKPWQAVQTSQTFSLPAPEFSFSEVSSQESPPPPPPTLELSPLALSFFSYLSHIGCQVAPGTLTPTPNRFRFPSLYCLPSSGHRAYGPPLQFCPIQDTLDLNSTVPVYGAQMALPRILAHHT